MLITPSVSVFLSLLHFSIAEDATIYDVVPRHQFSEGELHYHTLLIDQWKKAIYVGGMNYVYRLLLTNINDTRNNASYTSQYLPPDVKHCTPTHFDLRSYECQNHVRTLLKIPSNPDELFVCGTNAFEPRLYQLNSDDLSIVSNASGALTCGHSPTDNTTAVFAASGNPFNGSSIYAGAFTNRYPVSAVIYRPENGDVNYLTRPKQDSRWLNRSQFVGSFDLDDQYVYYFFREHADEYSNGKTVYSRVARICKNDTGVEGEDSYKNYWSTFIKARLVCSMPGEFSFHFDHIQSVDHIQVEGRSFFYATFTHPAIEFGGSAVCVYSLQDINRVLDQDALNSEYAEPNRQGQCSSDNKRDSDDFVETNPLLAEQVQAVTPTPLFYRKNILLTQIAVYCGMAQDQRICVAFAADTSGRLYKLSHNHADTSAQNRLLATYQLPQHSRVNAMKIWDTFLYIAQSSVVSQLTVEQCRHYRLCSACIADPYCGWNSKNAECDNMQNRVLSEHFMYGCEAEVIRK